MGGEPLLAINLLAWPRDRIPFELAAEVLRGGADVCAEAGDPPGRRAQHRRPGAEVRPRGHRARRRRPAAAQRRRRRRALPLTLTKPLGLGILNNRHKATGERFEQAVAVDDQRSTATRRARPSRPAYARATDVTGFGLLGHLYKMARASGVTAVVDAAAVPYVDGARESLRRRASSRAAAGATSTGCGPHLDAAVDEDELVLLADAQTSGGLLVAGELPGHPVIGELVAGRGVPARRPVTSEVACIETGVHVGYTASTTEGGSRMDDRQDFPGVAGAPAADRAGPARPRPRRALAADRGVTARTATADRVARSVCPYCAVGCGQQVFVKDEKVIQIEGDPDSPISRGRLCPKGSASKNLVTSPLRQTKVRYRRPYGTEWEDLDLDTAMDMIADRVVKARDDTWQDIDEQGRQVRRTLGIASLGGATLDNEENYLIKKLFTAMGAIQIENQARI